jgi:hypothetical protein
VFGKRPFKETFGKKVVEATLFQASSFHRFHCSKAFGRIAWPWCQISSFEGTLVLSSTLWPTILLRIINTENFSAMQEKDESLMAQKKMSDGKKEEISQVHILNI